jgi:hypothetical protein
MLLAMAALLLNGGPRGASDQPLRSAGIVLKRVSDDGELYEGEEDLAADSQTVDTELATESLLDALPDESAAPDVSDALPSLPTLGAGTFADGGLPNAGDFTIGGGGRPQVSGGKTQVTVFGVHGYGSKFVFVFDRSVSMDGPPLAAAKAQLVAGLTSLEEIHQFQIIFFNHRLRMFDITDGQRRIAFANERNKDLAAQFVQGIVADGGTDRYAALHHAIRLEPDAGQRDGPNPAAKPPRRRLDQHDRIRPRLGHRAPQFFGPPRRTKRRPIRLRRHQPTPRHQQVTHFLSADYADCRR